MLYEERLLDGCFYKKMNCLHSKVTSFITVHNGDLLPAIKQLAMYKALMIDSSYFTIFDKALHSF